MANLSEVWKAIRDKLVGDATLTALLASSSAVYERDPPIDAAFPMLTIWQIDDSPNMQLDGYGEFFPSIQIDVWSTSPRTNEEIKERITALLDIPRINSDQISTTNYNVTRLQRESARFVGTVEIEADGKRVRHLATTWVATIKEK